MKLLKLEKQLSDGRTVLYHRVTEMNVDVTQPNMVVLLGSWVSAAEAQTPGRPDAMYAITMPNDQEHREALLDHILALPEWQAGQIVDAASTT